MSLVLEKKLDRAKGSMQDLFETVNAGQQVCFGLKEQLKDYCKLVLVDKDSKKDK